MTINFSVVLLGVIISIIFYEITNISPGGIIVPGLLVLYINQPQRIVFTLVVAILSYLIVKMASRHFIIFGKRRFVLLIIVSLFLSLFLSLIFRFASLNIVQLSIIGFTIPGLIANDLYKQGIKKTIPSLVIVTGIVELIVIIIKQLG